MNDIKIKRRGLADRLRYIAEHYEKSNQPVAIFSMLRHAAVEAEEPVDRLEYLLETCFCDGCRHYIHGECADNSEIEGDCHRLRDLIKRAKGDGNE
jgi:hypothetical protein